jgi:cytidylate kinase
MLAAAETQFHRRIVSASICRTQCMLLIFGAGTVGEPGLAVIAISQQVGSRGIELGRLAAEQLGWRFMSGPELIAEAARRFNVSEDQLLVFDLRTPHFWERLRSESHRYLAYIRAVLLKELTNDSIVVAGRTLAHQIPPVRYALRVRVVSPIADRVKCAAQEENLSLAAAEKHVRDTERESKARSQSLSGVDVDDPTIYDLIVNSSAQPMESIARTLANAAREIDATANDAARAALRDAAIAAEVHAALLAHPKIRDAQITVACRAGAVTLNGPGLVAPWDGLVSDVARTIDGVASVEVGPEEPPMPMPTA